MKEYSSDELKWLRSRWERDLINHIVIALNEGNPINTLILEVERDEQLPAAEGKRDFRGIDFSHQNIRGPWTVKKECRYRKGVSLADSDFSCADFSWVSLPRADLSNCLLCQADLNYAELILADFSGSDLTGADLTNAWLLDTKFQDAKVTEEQLHSRQCLGQLDFDYYAYER